MKYQTFTDADGIAVFSIVLADDAAPLELAGLAAFEPGENIFSAGEDLRDIQKDDSRYEMAQAHLRVPVKEPSKSEDTKRVAEAQKEAEALEIKAEEVSVPIEIFVKSKLI